MFYERITQQMIKDLKKSNSFNKLNKRINLIKKIKFN